jgi:hypothetical protein
MEPNNVKSQKQELKGNGTKIPRMLRTYRPRLSGRDVVKLIYLIREARERERRVYTKLADRTDWRSKLICEGAREKYKDLLKLLRKFERLDPQNFGYNQRWKRSKPKFTTMKMLAYDGKILLPQNKDKTSK